MNATPALNNLLPDIPDPESIRHRLAVVLTEADLLRAQLRVSTRVQRERERLRQLVGQFAGKGAGDDP
jgi:hypothetical protein